MSGETGITIAATYVAANRFSVAGNRVDEFYRGLRCRCDLGAAGAVTVTATASAYTGGVTVVTVREYILAETLTAVGHTPGLPAGSLPAHADEHAAGGYDPISHTELADVGEKTHAQIDAYLADVSAALSGETAARQALAADFLAHEAAANPHSGSASMAALTALAALIPTTAAQVGAIPASTGAATEYVDDASVTGPGIVQLATTTETLAGMDADRAVTPAGLAAAASRSGWGEDFDNFFETNTYGDITFSLSPTHSKNFTLNSFGDITFKE